MKTLKIAFATLGFLVLLVAVAGIYRFNFTNDDIYIETETGEVVPYDEYQRGR